MCACFECTCQCPSVCALCVYLSISRVAQPRRLLSSFESFNFHPYFHSSSLSHLPTRSPLLPSPHLPLSSSSSSSLLSFPPPQVRVNPAAAADHQLVVIDCLEDPDETLRRKTLDLLYRITNGANVAVIVEKLVCSVGRDDAADRRGDQNESESQFFCLWALCLYL
jgi:hypothetical protein